jgi:hypothetical protein
VAVSAILAALAGGTSPPHQPGEHLVFAGAASLRSFERAGLDAASREPLRRTLTSVRGLARTRREHSRLGSRIPPAFGEEDAPIRAPLGMDLVRAWKSSLRSDLCTLAGSAANRSYRGLAGLGNRASRRRINSTALSIASRNAFSLAGDGRRSAPANRRTRNIPATR